MKKALTVFFLLILLASLSGFFAGKTESSDAIIPDHYIVVYKDNVDEPDRITDQIVRTNGFSTKYRFSRALKGFTAQLSKDKLDMVKKDSRVAYVTQDREVNIALYQINNKLTGFSKRKPTPTKRPTPTPTPTSAPTPTSIPSLQKVPTGISRIGLNALNEGNGVGVAVVDTGIDLTHPDLAENIVANTTCISGTTTGNDDNGHGTHVAGIIAAVNNSIGVVGVAPKSKLIAVKVLSSNGGGSYSSVICGLDWVTINALAYNIKVVNMSLAGGGKNDNNCGNTNGDAFHQAVCKTRDAGVTVVVAAGNSGINVKNTVPANYDDAVITISALVDSDGKPGGLGLSTGYGADDTFASFSNYGNVVDLGAPGVDIYSTYKNGGYATLSGTSMATPHVAGASALYLKSNPSAVWNQVRDGLQSAGEVLGSGHTDPSGLHPEPVVKVENL